MAWQPDAGRPDAWRPGSGYDDAAYDDVTDGPELCDVCGLVMDDGSELYGVVLDSSAADPRRPDLDGRRRLVACGPQHLAELRRYYLARPFDTDELRAQILARAQRMAAPRQLSLDELTRATGLTLAEVLGALAWRSLWFDWIPESG